MRRISVNEIKAEQQLRQELEMAAAPWAALLGPDLGELIRRRIADRAPLLAAQLIQDTDDRLSAQTVIDLLAVLDDPPPAWYGQTPLGRTVARSTGHTLSEAVSYSVAAAILGVSKARAAELVARGKLDRHPEGGVTTVSVIARAVERAENDR